MARAALEPMHDEHVNVTPLIDVVMCLIIFFLVCGQLAKEQVNDTVLIPKAVFGTMELADRSGELVINLVPQDRQPDGKINPGVQPQVWIRGIKLENMNALTEFLRRERKESSNITIILRADQELCYDWIAPVLVSCAQANIHSVNFSTKKD